jgi:hypothetical protein
VKRIWKLEWAVCNVPMRTLARDPDVHLSLRTLRSWQRVSPQYAARRLAYVVETRAGGDWRGHKFAGAVDGCRNGILVYYYRHR